MSPEEPPLSFARISHGGSEESAAAEKEDGFDWPRVVVKLYPQTFSVLDDDGEEEDSTPHDSLNGACQFSKPSPSPFSTKKVMYDNEEVRLTVRLILTLPMLRLLSSKGQGCKVF